MIPKLINKQMSTRLDVFQNEETEMAVKAGNRGAAVKGQLYRYCLYQKSALKKEPVDRVSPKGALVSSFPLKLHGAQLFPAFLWARLAHMVFI